jgi:hypothetical protein
MTEFYHGQPHTCGETLRYKSTRKCVRCQKLANRKAIFGKLATTEARDTIATRAPLTGKFATVGTCDKIEAGAVSIQMDLPSRYLLALMTRDAKIWRRHYHTVIETGLGTMDGGTDAERKQAERRSPMAENNRQRAAAGMRNLRATRKATGKPARAPMSRPVSPRRVAGNIAWTFTLRASTGKKLHAEGLPGGGTLREQMTNRKRITEKETTICQASG